MGPIRAIPNLYLIMICQEQNARILHHTADVIRFLWRAAKCITVCPILVLHLYYTISLISEIKHDNKIVKN